MGTDLALDISTSDSGVHHSAQSNDAGDQGHLPIALVGILLFGRGSKKRRKRKKKKV